MDEPTIEDQLTPLPDDVLHLVCAYLGGVGIATLGCVSRAFQALSDDPVLWAQALALESGRFLFDTGSVPPFPTPSPAATASQLRGAYRLGHALSRLDELRWVPSRAAPPRQLGAREGTPMASFIGGDALLVVGGWTEGFPTIRMDLWACDLNALTRTDSDALLASPAGAAYVAAAEAAAAAAAAAAPADEEGNDSAPQPLRDARTAALAALVSSARALLASRSPSRTGAASPAPPRWQVVRPPGAIPRPRYGHACTTVLLPPPPPAAPSAGAAAAGGGSPRSPRTPAPALSPALLPLALEASDGGHAERVSLRRSLLAGAADGALPFVAPAMRASVGVPPERYGALCDASTVVGREAIIVTGGFFQGARALGGGVSLHHACHWYSRFPPSLPSPPLLFPFLGGYNSPTGETHVLKPVVDFCASSSSGATGTVHTLDKVMTAEWSPAPHPLLPAAALPPAPRSAGADAPAHQGLRARAYHAACYVDVGGLEGVLVSGGLAFHESLWDMELLSLRDWSVTALGGGGARERGGGGRAGSSRPVTGVPPSPRHGHSMTCIRGRVWVMGGADGGDILRSGRCFADVHVLDLATLAWSSPMLAPLRVQRVPRGEAAAAIEGGGEARAAALEGGAAPDAPRPRAYLKGCRRCHSATALGAKIVVFGGSKPVPDVSRRVYVIDTEALTIHEPHIAGRLPPARYNHAAVRVGCRLHGAWRVGTRRWGRVPPSGTLVYAHP